MTKILIAEHDPSDLEMIKDELSRSGINYITEVVQNEPGFINMLKTFVPDIVLSDYGFPSFDGYTAFKIKEQICPDTPFILVSGTIGEENSIELIKNGVTDFVLKDKMFTLNTKLIRALKEAKEREEKNKTEKELAQSETHLAEAQKLAKMGSWDFDIDAGRLTWSKELYNVFGADKKNIIETYDSFINLIDEEDRLLVQQTSRHTQATGAPFILEYHITTCLGEKRIIREQGHGKKDTAGKITRLFGTAQDITETRRSEAAIKKAYEEKDTVLERIDDGFFATDKDSTVTYWNTRAEMLLDTKKEDVLGKNLHEVFASKASGVFYNQYQKAIRENSTVHFEEFSVRTNRWFAVSAYGSANGLSVYFKDVTERKQSDNKLKESELRYRSLNEQATDAISITDASLRFIDINPYACEIFGYTRDEVLQLSLPDILFTEDLIDNPLKVAELQLGKTIRNERRLKRKDGTAVDMEVSTRIMEDGKMIMFGHDITERKKDEEKLRKANRLYTFISQVNQNIVHIKDEAELFRNSCQVAFEFGKFKIAWIGILNRETGKITLVDQKGIAGEDIPLFKDTSHQKNGPQDYVLSTGTYSLCNDIEHDLELQSWKLFAAKHGIRSAIVLPVKRSGQVIGTFNLYAAELNFFDKEEIALLTDVTEDISFALDIFEKAKKQKETEELIVKNEKRFRVLIEKSVDMKTLSTPEGKLLYGSASITKFLGYDVDELLGKFAFNLVHPDDAMPEKSIQELFATPGKSFHLQQRMLHKKGNWVWCEGTISNMLHEPGIHALVSNFRDISEKKIAEQQAEFDRSNLNALINNTGDLLWSVDKNCNLITFNQPFFDIIRSISGKDLIKGDDVFSVVLSPDQQHRFKISYNRAFSGEAFTDVEHITSPAESWSEISYYPIRNGTEIIGTACHSRDITERMKAEINLAQSEKKYRQIVETAQEGIWMIDENNETIFVNKKMYELLEYTEAEMMGRTNLSFKDAAERKKALEQIKRRKSGKKEIHESRFITKGGREIWVHTSTNPIFGEDGRYAGALAMMTDITARKRAEQEMTWLINNTEESFILLNRNLDIISFNSQFYRLYLKYLAITVVKGDSILKYTQPERIDIVKGIYKRVLEGAEETGEIKIEPAGNAKKVFALKYKPAKDEQGKIIGAFVSAIDVTEKKKSEQQLVAQEKRYRALVENGADAVCIISAEGKLTYASPTVEKILGYTVEETLKLDMFSIVHDDDVEAMAKVWEKVLASPGLPIPGHTGRMLHKNGSWRWLEATVTNMLHDPTLNGIVDNFRDVTQKKELENLLHKTNSLARIGSWEVDLVKGSLYWSDITREIHEVREDFIPDVQTAINFYKEGESRNLITQKIEHAIENGSPFDAELQIITAKENEKWIRAIGETAFANGKATRISGSIQDITDRKLAEIQLNVLNENIKKHAKKLALSNAELEQFAYVASHDLQEPLRMVTSFLTLLEKKYRGIIDEKGKQYIAFAVDGAKRMRQIILDLLEFSKVGKAEDSLENIDLNELVNEIKILFRKTIEEKNAQILVDVLPQIVADRAPMRQVFQNLISNALKYSRPEKPSKIHITVKDLQTHWQFAVSDNGIGIIDEYFDKIFIIFQRLHNKDEFSGTGMGLAIVKKIIETGGGKIWLESAEGKGCTFYFTMPKQH